MHLCSSASHNCFNLLSSLEKPAAAEVLQREIEPYALMGTECDNTSL